MPINLGTSSWQFDGWRGVFYPEGLPKNEQLVYYAGHFRTVETNTSFYGLPRPATLVNWVESVPPGFTFCLKFPRAISHEKRLLNCEEETIAFLDVLRALGPAAAPAFLQLPPDFSRQRYGKTLATYLDWLALHGGELRIAVEVRARDLMTLAFARFLAERGFALVIVDRVGSPDLFPVWDELVQQGSAPAFVLIRWIGDDKNGPKGDAEITAPRDAQLEQWAERLAYWHGSNLDIYGYMHNPYEGHSPASVRRLEERLAPLVPLAPWPPAASPPAEPGQLSLF
ncbi:MAG: hypothetical protein DCC55_03525 [Chloroflexi bacterium]|nr:MAG: hypothetical protein DCC55_03525 [Chloroflexota bacterium]